VAEFRRGWTVQWHDGCIAIITFCATLYFAPHMDYGIGIGVLLSLVSFFYRSMRPSVEALSYGPDKVLRDAKVFGLEECRHIAVIHFQGALFFANAGVLEDNVLHRLKTQKDLRHIHLVCSGITQIDASGEDALSMLVTRAKEANVGISFSGVVGSVAEVLDRTGVIRTVTWENVFINSYDALRAVYKRIQHDTGCTECPMSSIFAHEGEQPRQHAPLPDSS
jgi:MFS superfamily sulfate permease-like transporter